MGLISYTLAQSAAAIRATMPRGPIWESTGVAALAEALAGTLQRASARVADLFDEALGSAANETLAAWGREFGLLDNPCSPWPATKAAARTMVQAAERAQGGQTPAYYISVAAALGVTITITEVPFSPFRCGRGRCGAALNGAGAAHEWLVTAPSATSSDVRTRLECIVARTKPAHTVVHYAYTA